MCRRSERINNIFQTKKKALCLSINTGLSLCITASNHQVRCDNLINCLLYGEKLILLFRYYQKKNIYFEQVYKNKIMEFKRDFENNNIGFIIDASKKSRQKLLMHSNRLQYLFK